MSEEETITVADVSEGPGGTDGAEPGTSVDLPVVEILTGRGFITGKSGSGKSNTASVVIENLLSNNFPVLIVDTDGEYYGLKEEYEILHVGADDECDIQVSPEHAEKIASLALEQNVPIILDVSGYLNDDDAQELLLETARHLFAKEKKLKKPFLLVIEECHEYIPEKGGMDEAGKMLIKIGKRGRKHGLGIVGISQRPADVKKDYITQCDWLVWHRLTWGNDTKVVGRILGGEYADAIEDMGNGEGFLVTDWSESVRRVQFHRKRTFDAGATPGLDDFERPELKSVSGDLVSELSDISDEKERRESDLADLRQELDEKRATIEQLRRELEEARDMSRMADQFAQALLQRAEAPYRGGDGRNLRRPDEQRELREYERALERGEADEPAGDSEAEAEAEGAEGEEREEADGSVETVAEPYPGYAAPETADEPASGAADSEAADDSETADDPADRVAEPVTRADVREQALAFAAEMELGTREAVIEELRERIGGLPEMSVAMLRQYRDAGPCDPVEAQIGAGGDGDRTLAYGRNRPLRRAGFVRHVGRGVYAYALPGLIRDAYDDRLSDAEVAEMVDAVEAALSAESPSGGEDGSADEEDTTAAL